MNRYSLILLILLTAIILALALGVSLTGSATESVSVSVQARVTVLPAYNLSLNLKLMNKIVFTDDRLFFKVYLTKQDLVASLKKPIDVDLNYELLYGNTVIKKGFLKRVTLTKQDTEVFNIKIPYNLNTGIYTLKVTATNPQSYTASDKEGFFVVRRFSWI